MTGAALVGIYLFVLACFLGNDVIAKVAPTLQTALLAGMSALSGVVLVTGFYTSRGGIPGAKGLWGLAAVTLGTMGAVGGLLATRRLLKSSEQRRK
jgi:NAD(P) transhydrogenase subunit alpha